MTRSRWRLVAILMLAFPGDQNMHTIADLAGFIFSQGTVIRSDGIRDDLAWLT